MSDAAGHGGGAGASRSHVLAVGPHVVLYRAQDHLFPIIVARVPK